MSDSYKGESPGKKLARLHLWGVAMAVMPSEKWRAGPHLVLASREAGDVSVLLGLGVPANAIIGIDRNPMAVASAQAKFPDVRFECVDASAFAKRIYRRGEKLASAFLDFCAPLSSSIVSCVKDVLDVVSDGGFYGVGVLRGRERGEFCDAVGDDAMSAHAEAMREHLRQEISVSRQEINVSAPELGSKAWDRDTILMTRLAKRPGCVARGWMPLSLGEHHYVSTTSSGHGVPMIYMTGRIIRRDPGESVHKFCTRSWESICAMNSISRKLGKPFDYIMRAPRVRQDEAESRVRDMCLAMMNVGRFEWEPRIESGPQMVSFGRPLDANETSLVMNVSRSTLTAWRAHATRGTYDKAAE